ncbi:MAG: aconitate hydratase AcnA [Candidatus Eremiobacteraeota bacterium]|nr:aconitate hydratase AcnA [Candidatus Eremiobacteraeota bacterium]
MLDSFGALGRIESGGRSYAFARLGALASHGIAVDRLPFATKILLENLLRHEDGSVVTRDDILALARSEGKALPQMIAFHPGRVMTHDLSGVPALMDLAAMRDAVAELGGNPRAIDPVRPVDFVIDHSVQVDFYGTPEALDENLAVEYERNAERYSLIKWGQQAFRNVRVVPPGMGICHQVNIEFLASVVATDGTAAFPDTCVATDSHTPMVNGLGVLGWGVGTIDADAAMLGEALTMLVPDVVGVRLTGALREGVTSTDLVLTMTQTLRQTSVVGAFVEFFGPGLANLTVPDRLTLGNMAPEYGSTIAISPIDAQTLHYLRVTGRDEDRIALVEAYARAQGLFWTPDAPDAAYARIVDFDLAAAEPSMAGPHRPQQRVSLGGVRASFAALGAASSSTTATMNGMDNGSVVIAAITSCTNTSNPAVLLAAGLLAKRAVERGLRRPPWVKTSLAPGSGVVTAYLKRAGLLPYLERLGFYVAGYGCTTCMGNSGPLAQGVAEEIAARDLTAVAVLSGNRNFEGRTHGAVRAAYLASPPLVVAYALAGRIDLDLETEPVGRDDAGAPVYLRDLWPSNAEIEAAIAANVSDDLFKLRYANAFEGDERWRALPAPDGERYRWDERSEYVKRPPWFEGMSSEPQPLPPIAGARVLAAFGDGLTTDHISPVSPIGSETPAGRYLRERGVAQADFVSYGARRGNHHVMHRGGFATGRLKNLLVPGVEGNVTPHFPSGERLTIFDASERYREEGTPLVILAGREYGTGSSRDWAARVVSLLGVRVVVARSFERIHRSNLVGMGVVPLQFEDGEDAASLELSGDETFDITFDGLGIAARIVVRATAPDGRLTTFATIARIDTPRELEYVRHGGLLPFALRRYLAGSKS